MAEIARRIDKPLLANIANGGSTPILSAVRLAEMGYAMSIFPGAGFLSAAAALDNAYRDILDNGETTARTPLYNFNDFNQLIGFQEIWDFEKRYAS